MAVSITPAGPRVGDRGRSDPMVAQVFNVAFTGTYTANGEAITPAMFGLSALHFVDVAHSPDGSVVVWDPATSKLRVFVTGAALSGKLGEAAGGSNQTTVTARVMVWGAP
jgi:hypothetical protein